VDVKGIDDAENVLAKTRNVVARFRLRRGAISAPRDGVNMSKVRQLRRELVEDVCGITKPGEQDDRPTCASKIEHLQLHAIVNRNELNVMKRRVNPRSCLQQGEHCDRAK